jgi:hypothetical protein
MTSKSHVKDTGPRAAGGVVIVVNYRHREITAPFAVVVGRRQATVVGLHVYFNKYA